MKKIFILLTIVFMFLLASCDKSNNPDPTPDPVAKTYTITMVYDDKLHISEEFLLVLEENSNITKELLTGLANNVDYYEIDNFYNDEDYTTLTTFPFSLKQDISLYVKYKEKGQFYDLMFNSKGGSDVNSIRVPENTSLYDLPIPTRDNYDFLYWCNDSKATVKFEDNTKITDNTTLYAKWERSTYTLTYYVEGVEKTMEVKRNTKLEDITIPVNEGYSFVGWYTDSKCNKFRK